MTKLHEAGVYEEVIMNGVKPLIRELLLIDVANLIAYLTFDQHHQITDLVDSASEQFFAPGFIGYREAGSVTVNWNDAPSIKLEMVMNAPCHSFEFLFTLEEACASVKLLSVHENSAVVESSPPYSLNALKRAIDINTVQIH